MFFFSDKKHGTLDVILMLLEASICKLPDQSSLRFRRDHKIMVGACEMAERPTTSVDKELSEDIPNHQPERLFQCDAC